MAERIARPLPDGGYVCDERACALTKPHTHCVCGMPRARGERWCNICKLEALKIRPGQSLSADEFLMGFARLMTPGNDRRGFGYAKTGPKRRA